MTNDNIPEKKLFDISKLISLIKTNKKLMIILVSVISALVIGVSSTLAYLISVSKPVENAFTIGNISISLTETTGSSYKLIPGREISKNPKVTVYAGSEACYLFVKVTKTGDFDEYLTMDVEDGWIHLGGFDGVYYRTVDSADENLEFYFLKDNKITVKDNLTEERMSQISSNPTVSFIAYAIQSFGVDTVVDAWYEISENYK